MSDDASPPPSGWVQPPGVPSLPLPLQHAFDFINSSREEFSEDINQMPSVDVPAEQRDEYNALLQRTHRVTTEAEHQLPIIHMVLIGNRLHDEMDNLIAGIFLVHSQRDYLVSPNTTPRYILTLDRLKDISTDINRIINIFQQQFNIARTRGEERAHQLRN